METYIEKLHARDVRNFSQIDINFGKRFNFIAGPNGCGKTSVFAIISHCFYHGSLEHTRVSEASEFWVDLVCNQEKYRVGTGRNGLKSDGYRKATIREWKHPPVEVGRRSISIHEAKSISEDAVPLIIGASRSIKYVQIGGMTREPDGDQARNKFVANNTKSLYGEHTVNIKQWLVNRYFIIEKDWAVEERENWNQLIECLPKIAPIGSDFRFVRIGKDLEPVFSMYGKECYLEELSSGFQAVLLIISNVFEWVESRREGNRNVSKACGSVLVDELDLHLHPEWQFTLRDGLESVFPNIQFVVTTHSPHLLASARAGEVIVMRPEDRGGVFDLSPSNKSYSGWSTDQILTEIMDVRSIENKLYEKLIHSAMAQAEARSVIGLSKAIEDLEVVCHPSDAIVTVLKSRLAALMATEND